MVARRKKILTPLRVFVLCLLLIALFSLGTWLLLEGKSIPVLDPQGIVGKQEKDLIIFTLLLSVVIVVPVFVLLGVFAWKYREGNHKAKYTPDEDGNKWLELLWWGIPIIIIGILSVVTWVSTHQLDPYKPLESNVKPINVQVVALQWRWLFLYPDYEIATINELKIPVGTPVNFSITADAPMSAFWIPALGTQTYAMTGMTAKLALQADNTGSFRGVNTNINGKGYSDMTFTVTSLSTDQFEKWTKSIPNNSTQEHMGWEKYEQIAQPSRDRSIQFFHLHDRRLYNQVLAKYNDHGSMKSKEMHDHEGDK